MEELQSTEILDREILEDARKKALRILKTADDTVKTQNEIWEKKTTESINELDKKFNIQRELAATDVMARLPIDKHRVKVEKIESLLQSAVEHWYKGLSRAQIQKLLTSELAKRIALCDEFSSEVPSQSAKKRAFYSGLDRNEAETILKTVNGSCSLEEIPAHGYPSITIETESVRIIASIQKIVDFLLHEKRAELVEALAGSAYVEES